MGTSQFEQHCRRVLGEIQAQGRYRRFTPLARGGASYPHYDRHSGSGPRDIVVYRRFLEAHPLLFRLRYRPSDRALCVPLLRELCAWRRFARTPRGRG